MTIRLKGGGNLTLLGIRRSDVSGSVAHQKISILVSGEENTPSTISDANFNSFVSAVYYTGGIVLIEGLGSPEIVNLNPSVGAVASDGTVTRLASGIMRLLVKTPIVTLPLELDLRDKTDGPDQPNVFVSTLVGSLAAHLQGQVDSRINNTMTMAANGKVFSTQNHTTQSYVRNPNLWCADVDLTCISPWNSNGANRKAGTLVTPRHVISAAHYEKNVGNTIRFVAQDGTVYNRKITGKKRPPDYTPYYPDLTIYTLISDLPPAITPCKLMPANWSQYLVQNFHNRPPALGLDQEEKALIIDFNTHGSFRVPVDADRLIFYESKIQGDSGKPAFLIVNGELVLVTVWTMGGAGLGTPVASHIPAINQMIVDADTQAGVSTGYTVTEADFSAFPNYAS